MARSIRILVSVSILTMGLLVGPTYAADVGQPSPGSEVVRIPEDPQVCARMLKQNPEFANSDHGCWIEIEITTELEQAATPFGVGRASAHHGTAAYLYFNTTLRSSGPFSAWYVNGSSRWKYNGFHILPVWIDCSSFGAVWPYTISVTWCGKGLAQSYPYTDWGFNYTLGGPGWTVGHGARQQVWANGGVCCNSGW